MPMWGENLPQQSGIAFYAFGTVAYSVWLPQAKHVGSAQCMMLQL